MPMTGLNPQHIINPLYTPVRHSMLHLLLQMRKGKTQRNDVYCPRVTMINEIQSLPQRSFPQAPPSATSIESVFTHLELGLQDKAVDSRAGALNTDLSFPWDKPKLKFSDHSITGENPPKQEMEHERQRNQSIWKNVPLSDQYEQTQMMWVGRIKDRRYLGRKSLQTEKSVVKTSFNLTFYKSNQIILSLGVIQIQKDKLLRNRKLFQRRARKLQEKDKLAQW